MWSEHLQQLHSRTLGKIWVGGAWSSPQPARRTVLQNSSTARRTVGFEIVSFFHAARNTLLAGWIFGAHGGALILCLPTWMENVCWYEGFNCKHLLIRPNWKVICLLGVALYHTTSPIHKHLYIWKGSISCNLTYS